MVLVDKDSVEESNLPRTLFTKADIGKSKSVALGRLLMKSADVDIEAVKTEFDETNAFSLVKGCDIILILENWHRELIPC